MISYVFVYSSASHLHTHTHIAYLCRVCTFVNVEILLIINWVVCFARTTIPYITLGVNVPSVCVCTHANFDTHTHQNILTVTVQVFPFVSR